MKSANHAAVYWTDFAREGWQMTLAATEAGLCYVGSPGDHQDELAAWVRAHLPNAILVRDDAIMHHYTEQFAQYFQGRRSEFTFPVDLRGTPFQLAVWQALNGIPFGQTHTYADIAERVHKPQAARAVGAAIGANPLLVAIPCHRVIGKNGKLTGYRGGLKMKAALLKLEQEDGLAGDIAHA